MAGENENGEAGLENGAEGGDQLEGGNTINEPPAGEGVDGGDGGTGNESGGETPERYEINFGDNVQLAEEHGEAYSELFREWGLTQEQVDRLGELEADVGQQLQEQATEELETVMGEWLEQAQNDPDIGGDKWDETMGYAQVAMKELGSDEFAQLLNDTGLGSHPALIKAFSELGKTMSDDTFSPGGASDETVDAASSWYGGTTPNSKKG